MDSHYKDLRGVGMTNSPRYWVITRQMYKIVCLLILPLFFLAADVFAKEPTEARQAVALLDYIAGDYQMAVSPEGGKVISDGEYQEMQDFVSLVAHYMERLKISADEPFSEHWKQLNIGIELKKPVDQVRRWALVLKSDFISHFSIATAPSRRPHLERGKNLYDQACASCHGQDGKANTLVSQQLDPSPTVFADSDVLNQLSPFKAYNTITFGIDGTPMPSFSSLSEEDRWALASYLFKFRPHLPDSDETEPRIAWQEAMSLTDGEILQKLELSGFTSEHALKQLSQTRHLKGGVSAKSDRDGSDLGLSREVQKGIVLAKNKIKESLAAYQNKEYHKALDLVVSAYLDGFEQSEVLLKSLRGSDFVFLAEKQFMDLRQSIREKRPNVGKIGESLVGLLNQAIEDLSSKSTIKPSVAFIASFTIIFREGLEAILLLLIIFSAVRVLQDASLRKWLHVSWIMALLVGGLTWLVARQVISGAVREGMEGWVSLVAAAVLIYVSFWLFAKRDVEKWKTFLISRIKGKKSVGFLSVGLVAFLAVYREVFETILFFEALRLQAPEHTTMLTAGVGVGFGALIGTSWILFHLGKRIPLNIFFSTSGFLLYALAIVFVGQGIHSLQEADYISQTAIPFVTFPTLGIFPYLESLLPQVLLATTYGTGLIWQQWVKTPTEESKLEEQVKHTSTELFDLHELGEHLLEHLNLLKKKLGKKQISQTEMKEVIGHMEDLDLGIHHVILQLGNLQKEIPRRFDEIFHEVQEMQRGEENQSLMDRMKELRGHLESLKYKKVKRAT